GPGHAGAGGIPCREDPCGADPMTWNPIDRAASVLRATLEEALLAEPAALALAPESLPPEGLGGCGRPRPGLARRRGPGRGPGAELPGPLVRRERQQGLL